MAIGGDGGPAHKHCSSDLPRSACQRTAFSDRQIAARLFTVCAMRACLSRGAAPGASRLYCSFRLLVRIRAIVVLSVVALNCGAAEPDREAKISVTAEHPVGVDRSGKAARVGVVSHIKVLSDKVADVSSLAAWKKSFIRDGM